MSHRKKIRSRAATPLTTGVAAGRTVAFWMAILLASSNGAVPAQAATDTPALAASATAEIAGQEFSAPLLESLRSALGAYEEVRVALAADRLEAVSPAASRLAGSFRQARQGAGEAAGPLTSVLHQATASAESLARAEDLATARTTFGELSRHLLLLAQADPRLGDGWHVFTCPMVETFGKWLQPTAALENPYMGTVMLACGSASDWTVPTPTLTQPAPMPGASGAGGPQPEFKPGIPGMRMVDVRDHKFLWREIDELQNWEEADRISIAEYRSKSIEKTAHFLQFPQASADGFITAASEAVASVRNSFLQGRLAEDASGLGTSFASDLAAAVARVTAFLGEEPRHQLFAPECKKWLLKLAFGPSEAKEAREAKQAQAE